MAYFEDSGQSAIQKKVLEILLCVKYLYESNIFSEKYFIRKSTKLVGKLIYLHHDQNNAKPILSFKP